MERSGNPVLRENTFQVRGEASEGLMTLQGTVNKSLVLLAACVASAFWTWTHPAHPGTLLVYALVGFALALVTVFHPSTSGITAPMYAISEGLVLGTLSLYYESRFPGIVLQSVGLTFGVCFVLLGAYKTRLIQVTERFRLGVVAATGGIAILYLIDLGAMFFGRRISFIHESGPIGIGFSLVVVAIASFNLVIDFDFIERGVDQQAPRYMEWYGGFSLMVTLIWLYMEILRLLSKARKR